MFYRKILVLLFSCVLHFGLAENITIQCRPNTNCSLSNEGSNGYWFSIKDDSFHAVLSNDTVQLAIYGQVVCLDDDNVPFFKNEIRTITVELEDTKLRRKSFQQALQSMNIVDFKKLNLYYERYNKDAILYPQHFEGMADLEFLEIECEYFELHTAINLEFLKPLLNLKELKLTKFIVPPLPQFTKLKRLFIKDGSLSEKLQPIGQCGDLEILDIYLTEINRLPDAWLSECTKLHTVTLRNLQDLQNLPQRMLQGVQHLRSLTLEDCNLNDFPTDLLSYTPEIIKLDISHSWISELPSGFFSNTRNIEDLNLGHLVMGFDAGEEFNNLPNLKSLILDGSYKYGKCKEDLINNTDNITMPFTSVLPKLEYLSLQGSDVTKICPEWSALFPSLKILNLTDHSIVNLTYKDVHMFIDNGWEVDLRSTFSWDDRLRAIIFTESDFKAIEQNEMPSKSAKVLINEERICDCEWYWIVRALKARPGFIVIPNAYCTWYDPPGSQNNMTAAVTETPEWKLVCRID